MVRAPNVFCMNPIREASPACYTDPEARMSVPIAQRITRSDRTLSEAARQRTVKRSPSGLRAEDHSRRNVIFNLWIWAGCLFSNWRNELPVQVGVTQFSDREAGWPSTTSSQSFPLYFCF